MPVGGTPVPPQRRKFCCRDACISVGVYVSVGFSSEMPGPFDRLTIDDPPLSWSVDLRPHVWCCRLDAKGHKNGQR